MEHTGGRGEQQQDSLPPEMYETSVSTSASGSWSTAGSRRQNGHQTKQQNLRRQYRSDGGGVFRGTSASPFRGNSTTPPPGAKPRPRSHSQEQPSISVGGHHDWNHAAPPQSPLASSSRFRDQYKRSPHSGIRESEPQNGYSRYATDREPARRGRAISPVSEPNFPTSSPGASRLAAHTRRFTPRYSPTPESSSHRSDDHNGLPSVSERIQKLNTSGYSYHDHPSYHYPDEQHHRQQIYMEQQQHQMYQTRQSHPQQQPSPHEIYQSMQHEVSPLTPNRAKEMRHRYDSEEHHYQNSAVPRHHLNHGMGGDVHPSRGHIARQQMAQTEQYHYGGGHGNIERHYEVPHHVSRAATTEDIPNEYSLDDTFDGTIETPSLASVNELRQRLWDEQESLQVAVKPSLAQHGDARHHWYYGPEMAGRQGQRVHDMQRPRQRMSRSLSPNRPQYRSQREQEPVRASYGTPQRPQRMQQQLHGTASAAGAETEEDRGTVFKSRFYQAAIAARRSGKSPSRMRSTNDASADGRGTWSDSRTQRPQSMPDPASAPVPAPSPVNRPNSVSPVQETEQFIIEHEEGIERVYSQDPTNGGSEGSSVARLVQQLTAVNRKNPEAALQKIDSILRAESRSSSGPSPSPQSVPGDVNRMKRYVKDQYVPVEPQDQYQPIDKDEAEEEEESDEDSDDETSVSSITNPTYMSSRQQTGNTEKPAHVPDISTAVEKRSRPNPLQMYGQQSVPHHEPVRGKSSRKKGPRPPPPETIKVKPSSSSRGEENNGVRNATPPLSQPHPSLKGRSSDGDQNAASIALKIRMWDEMSNPSTAESHPPAQHPPSSPSGSSRSRASESFLSTVNTDDLGSIMTPTEAGGLSRRSHPWDDKLPAEPRKLNSSGHKFDVNPALLNSPSDKKEEQNHAQNMSDSFDEAWVSLPSNAFFPAAPTINTPYQPEPLRFNNTPEPDFRPQRSASRTSRPYQDFVSAPTPSTRSRQRTTITTGQLPQSVADAFAGKEDLLPDIESISDVGTPTQARRSKLLSKLRKTKEPIPSTQPSASSARTSKPLLSEYARDSVDDAGIKNRSRRKSKSPGRARAGSGSDVGASRGPFWRRGHRI